MVNGGWSIVDGKNRPKNRLTDRKSDCLNQIKADRYFAHTAIPISINVILFVCQVMIILKQAPIL